MVELEKKANQSDIQSRSIENFKNEEAVKHQEEMTQLMTAHENAIRDLVSKHDQDIDAIREVHA